MSNNHIQQSFDADLQKIKQHIIGMADMVNLEVNESLSAFAERNEDQANDTMETDQLIDASERIIDDEVVRAIVQHQPMATDCRQLVAALRISRELERIGDYSSNIAMHSITLDQLELTGEEIRVLDMGHAVLTMLEEVIEAYTDEDAKKAELIRQQDEAIDEIYSKIFADLLQINAENPGQASACTHLIFIARFLERMGDIITNIAEEILFIIKGNFTTDTRPKADTTAFISTGDSKLQHPN
jgi:phosphate transport system protein